LTIVALKLTVAQASCLRSDDLSQARSLSYVLQKLSKPLKINKRFAYF